MPFPRWTNLDLRPLVHLPIRQGTEDLCSSVFFLFGAEHALGVYVPPHFRAHASCHVIGACPGCLRLVKPFISVLCCFDCFHPVMVVSLLITISSFSTKQSFLTKPQACNLTYWNIAWYPLPSGLAWCVMSFGVSMRQRSQYTQGGERHAKLRGPQMLVHSFTAHGRPDDCRHRGFFYLWGLEILPLTTSLTNWSPYKGFFETISRFRDPFSFPQWDADLLKAFQANLSKCTVFVGWFSGWLFPCRW